AALWIDAQESGISRQETAGRRQALVPSGALAPDSCLLSATPRKYVMDHAFLGPEYSDPEIEQFLQWSKVPYRRLADLAEETVDLLVRDKVIGWFQGRM